MTVYVVIEGRAVLGVFSALDAARDWVAQWHTAHPAGPLEKALIVPFLVDDRLSERAVTLHGVGLRGAEVVKVWTAPAIRENGEDVQTWREDGVTYGVSSRGFAHALRLARVLGSDAVLHQGRA